MNNPFQLTADQLAQFRAIFDAQMELPPEQQNWTAAYRLISEAIQNSDVSSGVKILLSRSFRCQWEFGRFCRKLLYQRLLQDSCG